MNRKQWTGLILVVAVLAVLASLPWYGDPPGRLECAAIAHTIVTGCREVPASGGAR